MDATLIKTVNKLQDAFATVGVQNPVDLPQIVVIGSQSSGKSSVLENIVGRDFLPRGTGIVTRRPLVLQLINRPSSSAAKTEDNPGKENVKDAPVKPVKPVNCKESETSNNEDEWGEFLHMPGVKFNDFNKIRDEIVKDTEAKTGKNAGISPAPINLRIYSPNVLTLTLVDLPGLTKVPVGDQPKDIEKQIKDMILKYITKPNAIILAVTAANTDLANSDGLKLAREVDPEAQKVKLDHYDFLLENRDQGTDVVDILAGRIIPLRLGYVPVVNRGQKDIDSRKAIAAALEAEKNFFENHPAYKSKAQYCGTPFLARKLNMSLGDPLDEGLNNSANIVLNIITEFCTEFRTIIDGNSNELSSFELSGGARISFVFHEVFASGIKTIDPFDQIKDVDIRTILYNSSGSAPSLFIASTAFEVIIKQQIKRLEEPSLKCVTLVYEELVRILSQLLQKQLFKRFPGLKDKFYSVVINFYKKALSPTNKLVQDLVNMEASYINTGHPDFLNGHKVIASINDKYNPKPANPADPKTGRGSITNLTNPSPNPLLPDSESGNTGFFGSFFTGNKKKKAGVMEPPPPVLKASGNLSERESMETEIIKTLIQSYFNIVKRTIVDMVPKAVMLNLVSHTKEELQRELLQELYKADVLDELLKESEYTQQRRKECKKMIEALQKADEDGIGLVQKATPSRLELIAQASSSMLAQE
ncbi:25837_t:CDS:10, partial [Racocetra persica]